MNINRLDGFNLEELVFYQHKFRFTAEDMPKDGVAAYITRGAPDWLLYNKHASWQICAERSLYYDCRGRLGLVIGKVNIVRGVGDGLNKLFRVDFLPGCRGMWSNNNGIIKKEGSNRNRYYKRI